MIVLATQTIKIVGNSGSNDSAWIAFAGSVLVAIVSFISSVAVAIWNRNNIREDRKKEIAKVDFKEVEELINKFTELMLKKAKTNQLDEPKDTSDGFIERDDTDFSEEYNLVGHRLMNKLLLDPHKQGWDLYVKVFFLLELVQNNFKVSTKTFKDYEKKIKSYLQAIKEG